MLVCWFGEHSVIAHLEADIPSLFTIHRLDNHCIEQSFTTDLLNHRMLNLHDFLTEYLAKAFGSLHQVFIFNDLEGCHWHFSCHWVTAECRAMFSRFDVHHDIVVGEHCWNRHHAATESLTQYQHVRTDAFVVASKHLTGTCNTTLNLVSHE